MDWISGIQCAINYIEEHLLEQTDYDAIAKSACSSPFHFQRIFTILCGYSVGDYIRMRRLSLAGEELSRKESRIIDIALKYGYETPESFTRAFTRFHGITPSEAKKGGAIHAFSPLSVKLILSGGTKMDYRIEKLDEFQVLCRRKQVHKPQDESATQDISGFWAECGMDGTIARMSADFPANPRLKGLLGICFSAELDADHFPYGIGIEYDGRAVEDKSLELVTIPAHTYAVFTSRGKMPEAFQNTYHRIVTEFFPQSAQYEYACGIELEVYPSDEVTSPDYSCEIWIAVNEK